MLVCGLVLCIVWRIARAVLVASFFTVVHRALLSMTVETGLRSLLTWLQSNNITWHQDIVDIRGGDNGTAPFAIFAKQSIVGNESLCKIPKDVVLSVKNTKIADIIEAEQLGGGLGLILAIMFEYSIGDKSKW